MNKQAQAATPLVFFQLNKIDEAQRLVYGRAVQEVPDRVGEIFDYESSVPNFKAWSASQFDASMGKSNGNVREMHKDVAAGVIIPGGMKFHDDERAIDICTKITDDQAWQKVLGGVYTGFSIGGRYAKKWEDPELKKTRYTADPSEISLVDRPCIGTATFFEVQKADGTLEKRDFVKLPSNDKETTPPKVETGSKDPAEMESDKTISPPEHPEVGDEWTNPKSKITQVWNGMKWQDKDVPTKMVKAFKFPADAKKGAKAKDVAGDEHLNDGDGTCKCEKCMGKSADAADLKKGDAQSADGTPAVVDEYDIEATPEQVEEFVKLLAEKKITISALIDDLKKIAAREDASPKEGKAKYGNVKFADEKNKKYPLDTEEHVRAAASYWGQAKNKAKYSAEDQKTISAKIAAAEKEHKIGEDSKKFDPVKMRKNLSLCAEFAQLIGALAGLQERIEYEEEIENDDTELPARLMNCIVDLGDICSEMIKEEVAEHAEDKEASPETGVPQPMAMAQALADLKKRAETLKPLIKYGARHSQEDAGHLQKAHDALNALGAKCNKAFLFADDEPGDVGLPKQGNLGSNELKTPVIPPNDKAEPTGDLKKMADENAELRKIVEQLGKDVTMLKAQPLPTTVRLRAVGKGEDLVDLDAKVEKVEPVKDSQGKENEAATLIKGMHKTGGEPLFKR